MGVRVERAWQYQWHALHDKPSLFCPGKLNFVHRILLDECENIRAENPFGRSATHQTNWMSNGCCNCGMPFAQHVISIVVEETRYFHIKTALPGRRNLPKHIHREIVRSLRSNAIGNGHMHPIRNAHSTCEICWHHLCGYYSCAIVMAVHTVYTTFAAATTTNVGVYGHHLGGARQIMDDNAEHARNPILWTSLGCFGRQKA